MKQNKRTNKKKEKAKKTKKIDQSKERREGSHLDEGAEKPTREKNKMKWTVERRWEMGIKWRRRRSEMGYKEKEKLKRQEIRENEKEKVTTRVAALN
jgi:hypothetical protein